jgi:predicted chitinase
MSASMDNKTSPTNPSHSQKAADTKLKLLPFAFPFLKKGKDSKDAPVKFTDEHEIYRLLADKEPSGSYLISSKGMWHGGIHITSGGAGQALDLDRGIVALAEGHVIAYRVNHTYPVSQVAAQDGQPAFEAPYSTGFALVRHTMEFPKGTTLTFYSLYMHLQAYEDYARNPKQPKPAYWSTRMKVTEYAQDPPEPGKHGQVADSKDKGIRIRATSRHGKILAVLPQGETVSIGKRENGYGQITNLHDSRPRAPEANGYVDAKNVVGGWIYLGVENGGPVVEEVMPDSAFDRVVVLPESEQVPIKAGELIGHLGRYESLTKRDTGNRMVHIEVFCDDSVRTFIETGQDWIKHHAPNKKDWEALGLSAEPTILRIARKTKLYEKANVEGKDAKQTGVTQVYAFSELARGKTQPVTEEQADRSGYKAKWWFVESADVRGQPINGWVREQSFAGGCVTREFAQKWVDFEPLDDSHDPTHSIFANAQAYVDYLRQAPIPNAGSLDKLNPLMRQVCKAVFTTGDGAQAADELCNAANSEPNAYPWLMRRMSRLIVKHESEWANPQKWKQLIAEMEKHTGPQPQHAEDLKRIDKLVWWDEVKTQVPGFPGPDVFHIHPIGLVGNFQSKPKLITLDMLAAANPHGSEAYHLEILPILNKYAEGYEVNTPKRIAHFLSQIAVESQFKNIEEGLSYSAKRMKQIFGCKAVPKGDKRSRHTEVNGEIVCTFGRLREKLWTETSYYEYNPEHLGNYVYEKRNHNGDEKSGDGYKYRGRGLIQTTFKSNYEVLTEQHNLRFPNDRQNFVDNPDLVLSNLEYGIESAFVYWVVTRGVNAVADTGSVRDITRLVNGGDNAYMERWSAYNRVAPLLGAPIEKA